MSILPAKTVLAIRIRRTVAGILGSINVVRFLRAARKGNLEKVSALLSKRVPIGARDKHGKTALHYAARRRDEALTEFLIEKNASCLFEDNKHETPLKYAVDNRDHRLAEILLAKGGQKYLRGENLGCAVRNGDNRMVELLLAKGADIKGHDFCTAASADNYEMIELLLAKNGDIKNSDVLCIAAASASYKMTEFLLAKGADVNRRDSKGYTPLCYAVVKRRHEIAELLRRHGGRIPSKIQKSIDPSPANVDIEKTLTRVSAFAFATERAYIEVSGSNLLKELRLSSIGSSTYGTVTRVEKSSALEIDKALKVLEDALHQLNDLDALASSTVDWITAKVTDDLESTSVWREGKRTRVWPL